MSSRPLRRAIGLSLASVVALVGLPSAGTAEPGPWPGLPAVPEHPVITNSGDRNLTGWLNPPANGVAGSVASQQWLRMPTMAIANNIVFDTTEQNTEDTSDGAVFYDARFAPEYFLVSPPGSAEPYGYGPVMPVRTVAFGSIPVEVEIQVRQQRDPDGLPVPISSYVVERYVYDSTSPSANGQRLLFLPASIDAQVSIAVLGLEVDGVDVGIGPRCSTPPTARLSAESPAYANPGGEEDLTVFDPRDGANGFVGGTFYGTVDIPGFTSCRTSTGDDLAPLLTSALSGPQNPVAVQYGSLFCVSPDGEGPPRPGQSTPEAAGCSQFQYAPENPDLWAVPLPWDLPGFAPGSEPITNENS